MSAKKEALGKGIRALLSGIEDDVGAAENLNSKDIAAKTGISRIPLDLIEINPFQPRAEFNEEKLNELKDSIETHGVIQPITLRALGKNKYQLISGERRLRASKLAGLKDIPAYVREADDQEMLEIALIENIQREDLNAIEISINYQRLLEECELTQDALGKRLGKNRSTVTNYLRLLKLPPEIQSGIRDRKLSMGHARALIALDDSIAQIDIFNQIMKRGLSVRQVENLSKNYKPKAKRNAEKNKDLPLAYRKIQDELSSVLSAKVLLKPKKGNKGEIVINYSSDEELDRLLDQLSNG
ncbi:MAG: ParB/RepB/Spo0J family partition protein [Chitinophagales bacterium]